MAIIYISPAGINKTNINLKSTLGNPSKSDECSFLPGEGRLDRRQNGNGATCLYKK